MLLIDELDRADEEFESFLLELLSDFQMTHPRARHALRAKHRPHRHDHLAIARARCTTRSSAAASTTGSITRPSTRSWHRAPARRPPCRGRWPRRWWLWCRTCAAGTSIKLPGVAETLDWAAALLALEQQTLTADVLRDTLGVLLKHQEDIERLQGETVALAQKAEADGRARG